MYFRRLYEGATQYGWCQNRRKIGGDRNARPAQKAFQGRQVGRRGIMGDFKNIIASLKNTPLRHI